MLSSSVFAKTKSKFYDLAKVVAVQNRPYYVDHDLSFALGWLPSDAFNKGYTAGLSYTYSFNSYVQWEVFKADYVVNSPTNVKDEFLNLGVTATDEFTAALDYPVAMVTTNFVYTPFYNKSLLFNDTVIHGNTSLLAGVGAAKYNETGTRLIVDFGLMIRFFTDSGNSWKVEFRNNFFNSDVLGIIYGLHLNLAYSFELGSGEE